MRAIKRRSINEMDPPLPMDLSASENAGSSVSSSSDNQDTKACCTCHKELPVDQFHKCKAAKDGLQWCCKSCNIAAQLRWARNRVVGPVDNDNLVEDPSDVVDDLMIVEELTPDSLYIMENP